MIEPYSDDEDAQIKLPQPKDVDKIYNSIQPFEISLTDENGYDTKDDKQIIEIFLNIFGNSYDDIYLDSKKKETLAKIKSVNDCLDYISNSLNVLKNNINEEVVEFNEGLEIKKNPEFPRFSVLSEEDFNQFIEFDSILIREYKTHQTVLKRLVKRQKLKSAPTASVVTPAGGSSEKTVKKPDIDSTSNDIPSVVSPENTRQITLKGGKIITITDFKLITDGASGVIDGKRFTVTRTSGVMAGGKRGVKKSRKRKPSRRL
jgi:hypothetical protein